MHGQEVSLWDGASGNQPITAAGLGEARAEYLRLTAPYILDGRDAFTLLMEQKLLRFDS